MQDFVFRIATQDDIPQLMGIRNSVTENQLSDPERIRYEDYAGHLTHKGQGWVCEADKQLLGFSVVDILQHNVWALFVLPGYERKGIGRQLHDMMLDWYFSHSIHPIWLGTAPGTRAEQFYLRAGWTSAGLRENGEIYFEMSRELWKAARPAQI